MLPDAIAHPAPRSRLGKAVATVSDAGPPMSIGAERDLLRAEHRRLEQRHREGGVVLRSEIDPDVTEDDYIECVAFTLVVGCYLLGDGTRRLWTLQNKIVRQEAERVANVFDLTNDDVIRAVDNFFSRIGRQSLDAAIAAGNPNALALAAMIRAAQEQWLELADGVWYSIPQRWPAAPIDPASLS